MKNGSCRARAATNRVTNLRRLLRRTSSIEPLRLNRGTCLLAVRVAGALVGCEEVGCCGGRRGGGRKNDCHFWIAAPPGPHTTVSGWDPLGLFDRSETPRDLARGTSTPNYALNAMSPIKQEIKEALAKHDIRTACTIVDLYVLATDVLDVQPVCHPRFDCGSRAPAPYSAKAPAATT